MMIENIVIVFGVLMLIIVAFFVGVWTGISSALDMSENESENESEDLYCFDCEIEMPVKVKNGRMYCSNCGLPH